jgi:hypothetical protein
LSVGSSNDNDFASGLKAIHQRQQLGYHPSLNLTCNFLPFWGYGIDFIDKYD